jgi:spoIIIJ-associated protein
MTIDAFLTQLCEHCGIGAEQIEVSLAEVEDRLEIQLTVPEEESGRFIGYHGEALQAIQRVVRLAFEQQYPDQKIILNVNDYRERRQAQLEEKVQTIAQQVLEDGRSYTFSNFIPSHERFIIHSALANVPDGEKLESFSQGDGMGRRLTIALKQTNETVEDEAAKSDETVEDGEAAVDTAEEVAE